MEMNITMATKFCQSQGGSLPIIGSPEENKFVTDQFMRNIDKDVWLGAYPTDTSNKEQFVWYDFTKIEWFNWGPDQPNNYRYDYGYNQIVYYDICLDLNHDYSVYEEWKDWTPGYWNDISCSKNNYVLCQKPAYHGDMMITRNRLEYFDYQFDHKTHDVHRLHSKMLTSFWPIFICNLILIIITSLLVYLMYKLMINMTRIKVNSIPSIY